MHFSKSTLLSLFGLAAFVIATPTPEAAAVSSRGNILARFSHPSFGKREGDDVEDLVCTGGCDGVSAPTFAPFIVFLTFITSLIIAFGFALMGSAVGLMGLVILVNWKVRLDS